MVVGRYVINEITYIGEANSKYASHPIPRRLGMSLSLDIRLGTRTRIVGTYCEFTHLHTLDPSLCLQ